jgi:hypothetical protein
VLQHLSVREIAAALRTLPPEQQPKDCSKSTIGRDVAALRQQWRARTATVIAELIAEELAKLDAADAVYWPRALAGKLEALDRWLAIHRQRMALLTGGRAAAGTAAGVAAGAHGVQLPVAPTDGALRVLVEYVDDWRAVRHATAGELAEVVNGKGDDAAADG